MLEVLLVDRPFVQAFAWWQRTFGDATDCDSDKTGGDVIHSDLLALEVLETCIEANALSALEVKPGFFTLKTRLLSVTDTLFGQCSRDDGCIVS